MQNTKIQWCDSTVNPIMGCWGCELFPKSPVSILTAIDREMRIKNIAGWNRGTAKELYKDVVAEAWQRLIEAVGTPGAGHINSVTTTNVYQLRSEFEQAVASRFGRKAAQFGAAVIERMIKCYAAKLHLNKGYSIHNPQRQVNIGHAPTFEQVSPFAGRMKKAARWPDLFGLDRPEKPWMNGLPRLIFVSDMGDAFSRAVDRDFLKGEADHIQSDLGQRHLWLWLTKRPEQMKKFAASIGGMPSNVCAMTTVTSHDALHRVDALRETDANVRGISVEPLWSGVADKLDLTGIDWLIVGGESGAIDHVQPFHVEWAQELRALCEEHGVAFFCKQLGRRPMRDGSEFALSDKHGGDWDKWDDDLRVRQFPTYFHNYRRQKRASA